MARDQGAEAAIHELVDRQVAAIAAKDVEAVVADIAPGVVTFDALPPLKQSGSEAARARTAAWFDGYDGPIGYEVRDLTVAASGDVGVAHYLVHVTGLLKGGEQVSMWVRTTLGLGATDGRWAITHEHVSVPFGPDNHEARLDLTPT